MWTTKALLMILLSIPLEGNSTSKRVKRVLGGRIYTSVNNAYNVVSYFAALSTLHEKPWIGTWWITQSAIRKGKYGEVKCGGELLTPEIVQTACHCISRWIVNRELFGFVSRPWIEHHWEQVKVVYIGATSRYYTDNRDEKRPFIDIEPITTLKFVAHPGCGRIEFDPQPRTYDYGWIRVDPSWEKYRSGVPTEGVSFAPIYTREFNNRYIQEVLEHQYVCMHIGFGFFDPWKAYTSTRLRVGWGTAAPQMRCMHATASNVPKKYLNETMNWFCVESIGNEGSVLQGDSGGPVACNNILTGVVSGHKADFFEDATHNTLVQRWWSIHGSMARNHWSMSIEYREKFDKWMHDIAITTFLELAILVYTPFNYPYPTEAKVFSESQIKRYIAPSSDSQKASSAGPFLVAGSFLAVARYFAPQNFN